MKDNSKVVEEFNELVNMTASELEKWLKSGDSNSAGWPKEDSSGESVGHDSGRKIVEILQANPKKDPKKYSEDQIEHMRKVVSYCKRHLAQEEKANNEKSTEEVKKTKSYASLKNWGHDFLKGKQDDGNDEEDDANNEEEDEQGEEAEEDEGDKHAGDKRKQSPKAQKGSKKKRETRQGVAGGKKSDKDDAADEDEGEEDAEDDEDAQKQANGERANTRSKDKSKKNKEEDDEEEDDDEGDDGKTNKDDGKANGSGKSAKNGPDPGDKVSWKWGGGHPEGKVLDVKEEKATVKTKRGNEVSRKGSKEDPAVVLDAGKSKAIKSAHELD
ncbi:unnamed protein product [Clonostachys rosea]|uniref:Hypervirulence associated protein TUDOR domain-containing protein n=1 Tax=Bionectria ochroleuca TaxID=29856 RepID=A0ABY6U0G1_BIOOC|nr:unnamed protein product [Clonostachys rosea]